MNNNILDKIDFKSIFDSMKIVDCSVNLRYKAFHNINGPAIIRKNNYKEWYYLGKLHRKDGPAVEGVNGHYEWYKNGKLHRDNGPAIDYGNGELYYYRNNKLHSYNDMPCIDEDGHQKWYKYGKLHRENGPAIIINKENNLNNSIWIHKNFLYNVHKLWIQNDLIHNQNSHAVEYKNGNKQWY